MTEPPLVTCVVVAFHRPASLVRLLAGLRDPRIEIVVVNVGDDAQVAAVAAEAALPLAGNPGYAAAVNVGAGRAGAPVIVFMNDDLEIDVDGVLALAEVVLRGEADVAVPCVTDDGGRPEPTIAALPTVSGLAKEWLLLPDRPFKVLRGRPCGVQKWRAPMVPERVDAASAAIVAVSGAWLRKLPMPEDYFLYWEESHWFWQLKQAGAHVLFDPRVIAHHTGGRDDVRSDKSRLLARNAVRCVRRTQGRRKAALAWPVVVLWNARLVAVDGLRRLAGMDITEERLAARTAGLAAALLAWKEL